MNEQDVRLSNLWLTSETTYINAQILKKQKQVNIRSPKLMANLRLCVRVLVVWKNKNFIDLWFQKKNDWPFVDFKKASLVFWKSKKNDTCISINHIGIALENLGKCSRKKIINVHLDLKKKKPTFFVVHFH